MQPKTNAWTNGRPQAWAPFRSNPTTTAEGGKHKQQLLLPPHGRSCHGVSELDNAWRSVRICMKMIANRTLRPPIGLVRPAEANPSGRVPAAKVVYLSFGLMQTGSRHGVNYEKASPVPRVAGGRFLANSSPRSLQAKMEGEFAQREHVSPARQELESDFP